VVRQIGRRAGAQQIAEGHGGTLALENRADGPGCIERLSVAA